MVAISNQSYRTSENMVLCDYVDRRKLWLLKLTSKLFIYYELSEVEWSLIDMLSRLEQ